MPEPQGAKVYTPKDVSINADDFICRNWASISLSYNEDRATQEDTSADGGHLWTDNMSLWGRAEMEFIQSATAEHNFFTEKQGQAPFKLVLKDASGTSQVATMTDCKVMSVPDMTRAKQASNFNVVVGGMLSFGGGLTSETAS